MLDARLEELLARWDGRGSVGEHFANELRAALTEAHCEWCSLPPLSIKGGNFAVDDGRQYPFEAGAWKADFMHMNHCPHCGSSAFIEARSTTWVSVVEDPPTEGVTDYDVCTRCGTGPP